MLHQISWLTYVVSIVCLLIAYYSFLGIALYRREISLAFYRPTGKRSELRSAGTGDLRIPTYDVMGKAQADEVELISQDELIFGPSEVDEEEAEQGLIKIADTKAPKSRSISSFSEMIAEVKTLIRVINESSESKENFEMLFRLVIQKYQELGSTSYKAQVNDFLLSEGGPQFPFELSAEEIENYWISES